MRHIGVMMLLRSRQVASIPMARAKRGRRCPITVLGTLKRATENQHLVQGSKRRNLLHGVRLLVPAIPHCTLLTYLMNTDYEVRKNLLSRYR